MAETILTAQSRLRKPGGQLWINIGRLPPVGKGPLPPMTSAKQFPKRPVNAGPIHLMIGTGVFDLYRQFHYEHNI